jgi:hypothetical protein
MNTTEMELALLKHWAIGGVKEVFKYKNRIMWFREPHPSIDMFNDLTHLMFNDVVDIASLKGNAHPEEHKVNVESLIKSREALVEQQPYTYLSEVMKEADKEFMSLIIKQLDGVQHTIHKALDDDYEKLSKHAPTAYMKHHQRIWMSGYVMVEHIVGMLEVVTGIRDAKQTKGDEHLESNNNPSTKRDVGTEHL